MEHSLKTAKEKTNFFISFFFSRLDAATKVTKLIHLYVGDMYPPKKG